MKRTILVYVTAVALSGSAWAQDKEKKPAEQKPAAASEQAPARDLTAMGPGARKPTNEKQTKKEVLEFFKQQEELGKKGDFEGSLAAYDFPIYMATDDLKGVPEAREYSREEDAAMMKPFFESMPKEWKAMVEAGYGGMPSEGASGGAQTPPERKKQAHTRLIGSDRFGCGGCSRPRRILHAPHRQAGQGTSHASRVRCADGSFLRGGATSRVRPELELALALSVVTEVRALTHRSGAGGCCRRKHPLPRSDERQGFWSRGENVMKRSPMTWVAGGMAAAGVGVLAYLRMLRPWHLRWGATDEELACAMLGDELVKEPQYVTTRAITIQARPEQIWPWLVQMGEGRGGFYSYVWIERLLGMRLENAERILPEFQQLKVGEPLAVEPQDDYVMQVKVLEPDHALVLGGSTPPPWGDATWAMGLTTRLVSRCRTRFNSRRDMLLILSFLDIGQLIMERKWLLGVKERAERWAHAPAEPREDALERSPTARRELMGSPRAGAPIQ